MYFIKNAEVSNNKTEIIFVPQTMGINDEMNDSRKKKWSDSICYIYSWNSEIVCFH